MIKTFVDKIVKLKQIKHRYQKKYHDVDINCLHKSIAKMGCELEICKNRLSELEY